MGSVISVSQSKVKSWRTCRQQYAYKYRDMLERRRTRRPFQFGRMVHDMIDAFAEGDDPFARLDVIAAENRKLFKEELELYGDIVSDTRYIMEEYFDYWHDDGVIYLRRNGRSAEHPFEIELEPGIIWKGKIDAYVKTKGLRWLEEHKTFTRMPDEDTRWRSVQSASYITAIRQMGWPTPDGTLWDYIRSKAPTRPKLLKSGKLSAANIDTLPNVVEDTLRSLKLPQRHYQNFLHGVRQNRKTWFVRYFTPLSEEVIERVQDDFVYTAREMAEHHGDNHHVRTIGFHCSQCDYEPLCRAELQGTDVDFIKKREYIIDDETYHAKK